MEQLRGTTIVAVKRNGKTVIAGDGQVTLGQQIVLKGTAHKVRRIYDGKVIIGFAGGTADAYAMFEEFEKMLNKYSGSLLRSAVEYTKELRNSGGHNSSEGAFMIVADKDNLLMLNSIGDVIEPDEGVCATGSGGFYALSAAKALIRNTDLDAKTIALKSMEIASDLCIFTNKNFVVEEI